MRAEMTGRPHSRRLGVVIKQNLFADQRLSRGFLRLQASAIRTSAKRARRLPQARVPPTKSRQTRASHACPRTTTILLLIMSSSSSSLTAARAPSDPASPKAHEVARPSDTSAPRPMQTSRWKGSLFFLNFATRRDFALYALGVTGAFCCQPPLSVPSRITQSILTSQNAAPFMSRFAAHRRRRPAVRALDVGFGPSRPRSDSPRDPVCFYLRSLHHDRRGPRELDLCHHVLPLLSVCLLPPSGPAVSTSADQDFGTQSPSRPHL